MNDKRQHRRMIFGEFLEAIARLAHMGWRAQAAALLSDPTQEVFPLVPELRKVIQRMLRVLSPDRTKCVLGRAGWYLRSSGLHGCTVSTIIKLPGSLRDNLECFLCLPL
jgi:hypothetical protein